MLIGGIQRCTSPRYQREEMKILNILFPQVGMEPTACRIYRRTYMPGPRLA